MFENSKEVWKRHMTSRVTGLLSASSAGFCHILGNSLVQYVFTKTVKPHLSLAEVLFIRCLVQTLLVGAYMVVKKVPLLGREKNRLQSLLYLIPMGLGEVGNMVFTYYALKYIPVGNYTVIMLTVPVFTLILSCVLLRQGCSLYNMIFGVTSLFGVVVIANPGLLFPSARLTHENPTFHQLGAFNSTQHSTNHFDQNKFSLTGMAFTLAAAVCAASYYILAKFTVSKNNIQLTVFYPSIFALVVSPILLASTGEHVVAFELPVKYILILLAVGVLGFLGLTLMANGLNLDDAGPVVLMRNCDVIYGYVLQYALIGYKSSVYTIVGTAIVILSTAMIILDREFEIDDKYCCGKFCKRCGDQEKRNDSNDGVHKCNDGEHEEDYMPLLEKE